MIRVFLCAWLLAFPASTPAQDELSTIMHGRAGTAVVLDFQSGRILDSYHMEQAAKQLSTPGSTIKPFVLRALLDSGKLDAQATFVCPRRLSVKGKRLDCAHPASERVFDAQRALAWSCNGYFADSARRFAPGELERALETSGLTSASGLAEGELAGSVRTAQTLDDRKLLATGTEGIRVTALGLASSYRRLVQAMMAKDAPPSARLIGGAMEDSVGYGMAHEAAVRGLRVAGKTGTAADPGQVQTHGWFVGYAPADAPQVVIIVKLENARGADAAKAAAEILSARFRTSQ
jgi:peptidoglycan glycosyltransferase